MHGQLTHYWSSFIHTSLVHYHKVDEPIHRPAVHSETLNLAKFSVTERTALH